MARLVKHDEIIPSDGLIFELLRRYPELPSHYIATLLGRNPAHPGVRDRLAQLAELGYLVAYNPKGRISKHRSYSLNQTGIRDRMQRPHRILQSIVQADTEIGVLQNPDFEFIPWTELVTMKRADGSSAISKTLLDKIDEGENPHRIPVNKTHVVPDGPPFRIYHKPTNAHWNFIDEIDRNTEPLTTKQNRRNIEEKFANYNELFQKKNNITGFKSHYGFDQLFVRFFSTNDTNTQSMIRLWEKNHGKSHRMLFKTVPDWFYEDRYPKGTGEMFTTAYARPGFIEPYYINKGDVT